MNPDSKIGGKNIGGSRLAAICGLSRWETPLSVWHELTSGGTKPVNDAMYWGNKLESLVLSEFAKRTGWKTRRWSKPYVHPQYPFLVGHVDSLAHKSYKRAIVEAKTSGAHNAKDWEEGVPDYYIIQVQHYMGLTGIDKAFVAALVGGQKFFIHEVNRDKELCDLLWQKAVLFWENHVLTGNPPEAIAQDAESIGRYFKGDPEKSVDLAGEDADLCVQIEALSAKIKELESEKKVVEMLLKEHLKEAEFGRLPGWSISWKTISKKGYTMPDSTYRQFSCKRTKE